MALEFWQEYPQIASRLEAVNRRILEVIRSRHTVISQAAISLAGAGGKRIRPALVLLAADCGPQPMPTAIDVAAAVEILHMATLIHDDIIDKERYRRGQLTIHERYGSDIAVYTGDYLFTRCFLLLSKVAGTDQMEQVARVMKIICEGDVYQHTDRYNPHTTVRQYLRKIRGKTAALFALSAAMGARQGGGEKQLVSTLGRFGGNLGMAFQIRDDILDLLAADNQESVDKKVASDLRLGNYTLPLIYALSDSPVRRQLHQILAGPVIDDGDWQKVVELTIKSGGVERAQQVLDRYLQRAHRELDRLAPSEAADILHWLVDRLRLNVSPTCNSKSA